METTPSPLRSITYASEGSYDRSSPFYSLAPHLPSQGSGVTIGLGYDLGFREPHHVIKNFREAGISWDVAHRYLPSIGLRGRAAQRFLLHNPPPPITAEQADRLFLIAYQEAAEDVQRICTKNDVVQKYGYTNWGTLDRRIKELLIDLRYRGDYTTHTRSFLQKAVARNDVASVAQLVRTRRLWTMVPWSRFLARQRIF